MDLELVEQQVLDRLRSGTVEPVESTHAMSVLDWSGRVLRAEAVRFILRQPDLDPRSRIERYMISGRLDLSGLTVAVPVRFHGCLFDSPLVANDATVPRLEVRLSVLPLFVADRLRVDSDLDLEGTIFLAPEQGFAIKLDRAKISANLRLERTGAPGSLSIVGASIGGQLNTSFGMLGNESIAIAADQAEISGGVMLLGFVATGSVLMLGTNIGGQLRAGGASLQCSGDVALNLDQADVRNGVFLNDGFASQGEVRLAAARIGGQFVASGGRFSNPGGRALNLAGADVRDDVKLDSGFASTGNVVLIGTRINGDVEIKRASFDGRSGSGYAAQFNRSQIAGTLVWLPESVQGRASFIQARSSGLCDAVSSWPMSATWDLDGFSYQRFLREGELVTVAQRRRWLANQAEYARWPYRELARVFRSVGRDADAVRILMAEHNAQLWSPFPPGPVADIPAVTRPERVRAFAARQMQGLISLAGTVYRWAMRIFVGHGYQAMRALAAAVVLILIAGAVVEVERSNLIASDRGHVITANQPCSHDAPCLQPWVYAVDTVVPVLNLGQRDTWHPSGDAPWEFPAMLWLFSILGWVVATFVGIGLGSVIRTE